MTKKEQNLKILNNNFFYKNNFNSNKDCINDPISDRSTSENEKKINIMVQSIIIQ